MLHLVDRAYITALAALAGSTWALIIWMAL